MSERKFKTGRTRPVARGWSLHLADYFKPQVVFQAPPSGPLGYGDRAKRCLRQVLLNDQLGNCTAAGVYHLEAIFLANSGVENLAWSDDQVRSFYSATCGYVPGRPDTDNGGDEVAVLNYWRENGLSHTWAPHKIAGHLTVNGNDPQQVRTAIWLFENVYFGASMPDAWVKPEPEADGFVWDVAGAPVDENGHCFVGYDYDDKGVKICTWGMEGTITDRAVAKYATRHSGGELHTVLSHDAIARASKKAPNGFNWEQLVADFKRMGGNVPA